MDLSSTVYRLQSRRRQTTDFLVVLIVQMNSFKLSFEFYLRSTVDI